MRRVLTEKVDLQQWLAWIATVHPQEMDLGLERVKAVATLLGIKTPACPVIIVGGTNGKGSCVAMLEKIYRLQGYKVGAFTSPILWRHNELVRIQGKEAGDEDFCEAYAAIENARGEIILTSFEYHTLAAMLIFQQSDLDVWILEVGLGGRLDAVNILDADVAIVTSIAIDHVAWLGETRELIGVEKAGIFRKEKPVVCGDPQPPVTLMEYAQNLNSTFYQQGKDFYYGVDQKSWTWHGKKSVYPSLPFSALALQNISSALMAVELLESRLPVNEEVIQKSIKEVSLPGRIEIISQPFTHIFDVAHNPAAVSFLAEKIMNEERVNKAVFSMLGDKDIAGSIREIKKNIQQWYVAPLSMSRAADVEKLRAAFAEEQIENVNFYTSIEEAYFSAREDSHVDHHRIIIFGSFHTVAAVRVVGEFFYTNPP